MTERAFRGIVLAGGAVLFALGLGARFSYSVEPPPPPKPPVTRPVEPIGKLDYSKNVYRAALEADSRTYGVGKTTPEDLSGVLAYDREDPKRRPPVETRFLRITAHLAPMGASFAGGTATTEHIVLRIENATDRWLAYRVETTPDAGEARCVDKADLPHDAIALAPGQAVERTECIVRGNIDGVVVDSIETVVLPPLSYYYVSRLFPAHVGESPRATRGHVAPKAKICANIPEQAIRRALERSEITWRDVIDFYARHDCDRYLFPAGYHAFRRAGERELPVPLQP
ncbi:MAG TPA: hypothetical protein VKE22_08805 [Haliangiales bacterium]|nr:hypothetical protein [Haliangiales bacterium]